MVALIISLEPEVAPITAAGSLVMDSEVRTEVKNGSVAINADWVVSHAAPGPQTSARRQCTCCWSACKLFYVQISALPD